MARKKTIESGKVVRTSSSGKRQISKRHSAALTEAEKDTFLDHLAQCCNVSASAEACGRSDQSYYKLRDNDPQFAARWQAALEAGHATIEALLLERARDALQARVGDGERCDGESDGAAKGRAFALAMDTEQILRLMWMHRRTVATGQRRGGRPMGPAASEEEAASAILKKLTVLRKRLDAKNAKKA